LEFDEKAIVEEAAILEGKAAGMRSPVLEKRARATISTPWPISQGTPQK